MTLQQAFEFRRYLLAIAKSALLVWVRQRLRHLRYYGESYWYFTRVPVELYNEDLFPMIREADHNPGKYLDWVQQQLADFAKIDPRGPFHALRLEEATRLYDACRAIYAAGNKKKVERTSDKFFDLEYLSYQRIAPRLYRAIDWLRMPDEEVSQRLRTKQLRAGAQIAGSEQ